MSIVVTTLRVVLFASSLAALSHAGVVVVDPQGNPGAPVLIAALNGASDGDILLIRAGTYVPSFTIMAVAGKGLTLVNDSGGPLSLPPFAITGLPAGSTFALRGIQITGSSNYPTPNAAVAAQNCAGVIWLEDCTLEGAPGVVIPFPQDASDGGVAVEMHQVAGLVIERCFVHGGNGKGSPLHFVSPGGDGCVVEDAAVAIHDSSIRGGDSGYASTSPWGFAYGGDGLVATQSVVLAAGSDVRGANALCLASFLEPGSGLVVTGGAVLVRDTLVTAGTSVGPQTAPAVDDPGAVVTTSSTPTRGIEISSPVRSGKFATVRVHGAANEVALVLIGAPAPPLAHAGFQGSFVFGLTAFLGPVVFGTIPANGTLNVSLLAPPLPAGIDGATAVLQAAFASTATLEAATLYVQVGPNF